MDKNRVLFAAFVVLGLFLMLRKAERQVETPAAPPPVAAPAPVHTAPTQLPVPQPVPQTPVEPPQRMTDRQALDLTLQDIERHLATAKLIAIPPDPSKSRAACLADPLGTAHAFNMKLPPQTPPYELEARMASLLCQRRIDGCAALVSSSGQKSDSCAKPPCAGGLVMGDAETLVPGVDGCRRWASAPLFLAAAMEGRVEQPLCGEVLREILPQWPAKNRPSLYEACALLAEDYRTGGDTFCQNYTKYDASHAAANCGMVADFLKGESACPKTAGDKASCKLMARIRAALSLKDPARCDRDPLCLALAGPGDCSESRFYDTRIAPMKEFCDSSVKAANFRWIQDVADQGQQAKDLLGVQKRNLDAFPPGERAGLESRIDTALSQLDRALKQASKLRSELNKAPGKKG